MFDFLAVADKVRLPRKVFGPARNEQVQIDERSMENFKEVEFWKARIFHGQYDAKLEYQRGGWGLRG